jgi:hypothetical protein
MIFVNLKTLPRDSIKHTRYVLFLDPAKNTGEPQSITVEQPTNVIACDQDWRANEGFPFPGTANRLQDPGRMWMTSEQVRWWPSQDELRFTRTVLTRLTQETVANLFGWSSVVLLVVFVATFFGRSIFTFLAGFITKTYKSGGVDAQIRLSECRQDFPVRASIQAWCTQLPCSRM